MKSSTRLFISMLLSAAVLVACSSRTSTDVRLAANIATVGIMIASPQRTLHIGEKIVVPIVVRNNGVEKIPAEGKPDGSMKVLATYHWLREDGVTTAIWDGVRTQLPKDIDKEESLQIPLTVQAPPEPGKFILVLDLVQESAQWFAENGSQVARAHFNIIR